MKIIVDQDGCVASGQCVTAAADVFDQRDEDGIVVLPPTTRRNTSPPTYTKPRLSAQR
jgi:ferredoxin